MEDFSRTLRFEVLVDHIKLDFEIQAALIPDDCKRG